ncbi:hypothetical protein NM962_04625 [Mycobacterium sp. SVM_VP21]|nr:hypothetical protein NM962_04625 [Mycobacterium sp. SVM_VP21]
MAAVWAANIRAPPRNIPVALSTDTPFGDGDRGAAMRAAVHRTTPIGPRHRAASPSVSSVMPCVLSGYPIALDADLVAVTVVAGAAVHGGR